MSAQKKVIKKLMKMSDHDLVAFHVSTKEILLLRHEEEKINEMIKEAYDKI